jgi:hypothetical protein
MQFTIEQAFDKVEKRKKEKRKKKEKEKAAAKKKLTRGVCNEPSLGSWNIPLNCFCACSDKKKKAKKNTCFYFPFCHSLFLFF